MELKRPSSQQLRLGLRALKCVALAKSVELGEREREMLAGLQRFFGTDLDMDQLSAIDPDELAEQLTDQRIRQQLVGAMVAFTSIDCEADPAEASLVSRYATALTVDERAVRDIERLARHERFGLRIDVLRRFWAVDELRERVHELGLGEVLRFVKANVGRLDDKFMAVRFHSLRDLPAGTLGREYVRLLDDNGWPVPGDAGALSDIIVHHDMSHVLGGYGTDAVGEIETACFSAGYQRKEPFTFVLFVLLQFHAGGRATAGPGAQTGDFDCERALAALERGAEMSVDLTDDWDYWEVVGVPVEELRSRYGISSYVAVDPLSRQDCSPTSGGAIPAG